MTKEKVSSFPVLSPIKSIDRQSWVLKWVAITSPSLRDDLVWGTWGRPQNPSLEAEIEGMRRENQDWGKLRLFERAQMQLRWGCGDCDCCCKTFNCGDQIEVKKKILFGLPQQASPPTKAFFSLRWRGEISRGTLRVRKIEDVWKSLNQRSEGISIAKSRSVRVLRVV